MSSELARITKTINLAVAVWTSLVSGGFSGGGNLGTTFGAVAGKPQGSHRTESPEVH